MLARIPWRVKTIVWLDYDSKLDREVLEGIATVCENAIGGTALIVTVNAEPTRAGDPLSPIKDLRSRIGSDWMPAGLKNADLKGWGLAEQSHVVITNVIENAISERSRALPSRSKINYKQFLHFEYADGAKMVTVGGLLYYGRQAGIVKDIDFTTPAHIRMAGQSPYRIDVPNLTIKEMQHLDRQLPVKDPARLAAPRVPPGDLARYAQLYRHFPTYVDVEL